VSLSCSLPGILTAVLQQIKHAEFTPKGTWALHKFAIQEFMGTSYSAKAPPPAEDNLTKGSTAIEDLEQVYSLLSASAGTRISRPSAAVAFLRALGLADGGFDARFSKLTSRRRHEAHPDASFFIELQAAISKLEHDTISKCAKTFRDSAGTKTAAHAHRQRPLTGSMPIHNVKAHNQEASISGIAEELEVEENPVALAPTDPSSTECLVEDGKKSVHLTMHFDRNITDGRAMIWDMTVGKLPSCRGPNVEASEPVSIAPKFERTSVEAPCIEASTPPVEGPRASLANGLSMPPFSGSSKLLLR